MPLVAEKGILVLHVQDLKGHPIAGVRFRGGAGSALAMADSFGAIRLKLASNTRPGDVVMLELMAVPKNRDLVIISPWDKWAHVPPFEEEPKNFVPVVLVQRGDRACLESPPCLRAAAEQIKRADIPTRTQDLNQNERAKEALATVSKTFGLSPDEIDSAIRAWGEKTEDPYDKGLAALYGKNYLQASQDLRISLERRMNAEAKAQSDVADAAQFLGRSLYEQGKYLRGCQGASAGGNEKTIRQSDSK
jgi:hypothetical protein